MTWGCRTVMLTCRQVFVSKDNMSSLWTASGQHALQWSELGGGTREPGFGLLILLYIRDVLWAPGPLAAAVIQHHLGQTPHHFTLSLLSSLCALSVCSIGLLSLALSALSPLVSLCLWSLCSPIMSLFSPSLCSLSLFSPSLSALSFSVQQTAFYRKYTLALGQSRVRAQRKGTAGKTPLLWKHLCSWSDKCWKITNTAATVWFQIR